MSFAQRLIAWQKSAGRHDLPWQKTRDAYRVWLSEIMLQQTQVGTVIPYYQRFLEHFPDVATLARAPIDEVLRLWAGLGYYARARNLHRCAQVVVREHGGQFPPGAEQLATLPGIGRSTAAAIAAFAHGQQAAILDGNVKRVFCRHFGIHGFPGSSTVERTLWALAEAHLPNGDIEAYTQGLMDLGATCCTRQRPDCASCPVSDSCIARRDGLQSVLPERKAHAQRPERHSTCLLITDGQAILLSRRPPEGIWGGLLVPPEGEPGPALQARGLALIQAETLPPLRHSFTHFHLWLHPLVCRVDRQATVSEPGETWIALSDAASAGVPTPIRKLIRQVPSAGR